MVEVENNEWKEEILISTWLERHKYLRRGVRCLKSKNKISQSNFWLLLLWVSGKHVILKYGFCKVAPL